MRFYALTPDDAEIILDALHNLVNCANADAQGMYSNIASRATKAIVALTNQQKATNLIIESKLNHHAS